MGGRVTSVFAWEIKKFSLLSHAINGLIPRESGLFYGIVQITFCQITEVDRQYAKLNN
jgi:hypothetical protein